MIDLQDLQAIMKQKQKQHKNYQEIFNVYKFQSHYYVLPYPKILFITVNVCQVCLKFTEY